MKNCNNCKFRTKVEPCDECIAFDKWEQKKEGK